MAWPALRPLERDVTAQEKTELTEWDSQATEVGRFRWHGSCSDIPRSPWAPIMLRFSRQTAPNSGGSLNASQ